MNSGVLTKESPLDPVTTINSRAPIPKFSWVKNLFLFIKQSSIKTKFKKIYIHLLFYSIKKFLFLLVVFPKTLKAIFFTKNTQKTDKPKNRIFQYISNKLSTWNQTVKEDKKAITNNLFLKGLKVTEKEDHCMDPDGKDLGCMKK